MQIGKVIGHAVATLKHPSLTGWKLLLVQPLHENRLPDGEPIVVVDGVGAGSGDLVVISSDGAAARNLIGDRKTPVRWTVMGVVDRRSK